MARTSLFGLVFLSLVGCTSFPHCEQRDGSAGHGTAAAPDQPQKEKEGAKTLFTWAVGGEEPEKKANGDEKNGTGKDSEAEAERDEPKPIETDRPDFTEASSTVGKGRVQLESGYTYVRDRNNGLRLNSHSFPEALFRIGLFADWFELRIGQNYHDTRTTSGATAGVAPVAGTEFMTGPEDLYLGVKLALTEQKKYLPETALILQTTVPTGADELSADELLPGL